MVVQSQTNTNSISLYFPYLQHDTSWKLNTKDTWKKNYIDNGPEKRGRIDGLHLHGNRFSAIYFKQFQSGRNYLLLCSRSFSLKNYWGGAGGKKIFYRLEIWNRLLMKFQEPLRFYDFIESPIQMHRATEIFSVW